MQCRYSKKKKKKKKKKKRSKMYQPYRLSNTVIGYLNLLTLVASIPTIGAGLWLAHGSAAAAAATRCESALQTPLLAMGFVLLLVSLAGFVGACYHVAWALWLYLAAMLLLVVALLGTTVLGLAVTAGGGGTQVPGRPYREFRITDYSAWLQRRVEVEQHWRLALACVVGSRACPKIAAWTPLDYLQHDLTPIQSGCCKPPTSCTYSSDGGGGMGTATAAAQDEDCYRWSNAPGILCYGCESCKAGVLEQVRRDWHSITILNVILVLVLIAIYACGCCAFRNARRADSGYPPYGLNRISNIHPRWDYFWSRWCHGQREQLY